MSLEENDVSANPILHSFRRFKEYNREKCLSPTQRIEIMPEQISPFTGDLLMDNSSCLQGSLTLSESPLKSINEYYSRIMSSLESEVEQLKHDTVGLRSQISRLERQLAAKNNECDRLVADLNGLRRKEETISNEEKKNPLLQDKRVIQVIQKNQMDFIMEFIKKECEWEKIVGQSFLDLVRNGPNSGFLQLATETQLFPEKILQTNAIKWQISEDLVEYLMGLDFKELQREIKLRREKKMNRDPFETVREEEEYLQTNYYIDLERGEAATKKGLLKEIAEIRENLDKRKVKKGEEKSDWHQFKKNLQRNCNIKLEIHFLHYFCLFGSYSNGKGQIMESQFLQDLREKSLAFWEKGVESLVFDMKYTDFRISRFALWGDVILEEILKGIQFKNEEKTESVELLGKETAENKSSIKNKEKTLKEEELVKEISHLFEVNSVETRVIVAILLRKQKTKRVSWEEIKEKLKSLLAFKDTKAFIKSYKKIQSQLLHSQSKEISKMVSNVNHTEKSQPAYDEEKKQLISENTHLKNQVFLLQNAQKKNQPEAPKVSDTNLPPVNREALQGMMARLEANEKIIQEQRRKIEWLEMNQASAQEEFERSLGLREQMVVSYKEELESIWRKANE